MKGGGDAIAVEIVSEFEPVALSLSIGFKEGAFLMAVGSVFNMLHGEIVTKGGSIAGGVIAVEMEGFGLLIEFGHTSNELVVIIILVVLTILKQASVLLRFLLKGLRAIAGLVIGIGLSKDEGVVVREVAGFDAGQPVGLRVIAEMGLDMRECEGVARHQMVVGIGDVVDNGLEA